MRRARLVLIALFAGALAAPGCSSSPPPAEEPPPAAVEPAPAPVVASSGTFSGPLPPLLAPVPPPPPPPPKPPHCDYCYDTLRRVGWLGHGWDGYAR